MEQRRAINALEPFVLLSKSASSPRGAADLILQAISSPHTYIFAELLQTPNIQALRKSEEYSSHLKLLEIFSYGSYADYQASSHLPRLSSAQLEKLQQLSLLTLARAQSPLPYATLQTALSLPDTAALESLVGTAHAASLINGTLDPQAQLLYIDSIAPLRDLEPGSLSGLKREISEWSTRCSVVLQQLERQQTEIREQASIRTERQNVLNEVFEQKITTDGNVLEERGLRSKRVLDEKDSYKPNQDGMDIDDEQPSKTRSIKRTLMGVGRSGGS